MPEAKPRVLLLLTTYECSTIYFYSLYFRHPFRIGFKCVRSLQYDKEGKNETETLIGS